MSYRLYMDQAVHPYQEESAHAAMYKTEQSKMMDRTCKILSCL